MSVYVYNFVVDQGIDFSQALTIQAATNQVLNLTGYGGSSYIRKHPRSNKVLAEFDISFVNTNGGEVVLSLGSSITSKLREGRYVYDLIITNPSGNRTVVSEGMVLVRAGITT